MKKASRQIAPNYSFSTSALEKGKEIKLEDGRWFWWTTKKRKLHSI